MRKTQVPFLCTQNSTRSQMAEAFLRPHAGDRSERARELLGEPTGYGGVRESRPTPAAALLPAG